jgi:hypothetical protein
MSLQPKCGLITDGNAYSSIRTVSSINNSIDIREKISFFSSDPIGQQNIDYSIESIVNMLQLNGLATDFGDPVVQNAGPLIGAGGGLQDLQGSSVAISSDGSTIAIGATNKQAVWIFIRTESGWFQQGSKLTSAEVSNHSQFGRTVSLSGNGNTLAVGELGSLSGTGNVYIFIRTGTSWTERYFFVGTSAQIIGGFGKSVSLSLLGNSVAIGGQDTSGNGVIWVWTKVGDGPTWSQQQGPMIGTGVAGIGISSVSISSDATTIIAGAPNHDSDKGAIWIWVFSGGTWTEQEGPFTCDCSTGTPFYGTSVSISSDGNIAAIGGSGNNNNTGATWVIIRDGLNWSEQAGPLVGTGIGINSKQGTGVSISGNGDLIVVGGPNISFGTGQTWVFKRVLTVWSQLGLKLVGTADDIISTSQGTSVAISKNGLYYIVGGPYSSSGLPNSVEGASWIFKITTSLL